MVITRSVVDLAAVTAVVSQLLESDERELR
jgi:hypothetical protein